MLGVVTSQQDGFGFELHSYICYVMAAHVTKSVVVVLWSFGKQMSFDRNTGHLTTRHSYFKLIVHNIMDFQ